jgi:hypothetical protein
MPTLFIFAILALALNVVVGYVGLLHLGIAAFFGIGAYVTGILTVPANPFETGFWVALVAGAIVAALAGGLLGAIIGARRAFWLAAVLSAAGAERLDRRLLSRAGVDYGALVERAMETARQARSAAEDAMSGIGDEDAPPETA